ncbi:helix-turn-helix domain-containing protein [Cytobacillus praedii]|uniref:helix-turn-helix domain-containing protein n=1 Tax=Cytobacillus praedii TaxID=1742358 RepID=UPI003F7EBA8F
MLTTKEISEKLKVSEETVRRWIRKEELYATQEGKSYLVKEKDLEDFIKRMSQKTSTSIGKLFTLSAVAGAAVAGAAVTQKPSPKDIFFKGFFKSK